MSSSSGSSHNHSDSEDDAPEAVSLSQSKRSAEDQNAALRDFTVASKQKTRSKNRERDLKLKEQAANSKRRTKGVSLEQPNHLPDHVFAAANFTTATSSKPKSVATVAPKRKARRPKTPKDEVLGKRSFRVRVSTADARLPSASALSRSSKAEKFLARSLALKGGNSKTRGWERKPVNVGVMKGTGPAATFVRNPVS